MPPKMVVESQNALTNLDISFQELLKALEKANPSARELHNLFAPVRWRVWRKLLTRWFSGVVCLLTICLTVQYVPSVNWHATAIGRLALIELLPFWDWTPLYRAKCLISKPKESGPKKYEPSFSFPDDCVVCRNLVTVSVRENVTYETLFRHHLMRNVPVVVSDAHRPWDDHVRFGNDWGRFLADIEELLLANPCDFRTNLLFNPASAKTSALARMVDLLEDSVAIDAGDANRGWFVQLRNCAQRTVKKARVMFGKPYFYTTHWEPPYTSWILLSREFRGAPEMTPNMAGLVLVHQMRSKLDVLLRPRAECEVSCRALPITLQERQTLVFSTSLWNFSYKPSESNQTSVTFATETYENV